MNERHSVIAFGLAVALALGAGRAAAAQAPEPAPDRSGPPARPLTPEEQRALLERLQKLEEEVRELRRRLEQQPAPAAAAPTRPATREAPRVTARPYGYIQSQFETTPSDGLRFFMRRVRVGVRGEFGPDWEYRAQADFAAERTILRDAYMQWNAPKHFGIRFGHFRVPFGYEGYTSTSLLPTIERTFIVGKVYHERDTGVMLLGEPGPDDWLDFGVAVVNGSGRGQFRANEQVFGSARIGLRTPQRHPFLGGQLSLGVSTQQGHEFNLAEGRPEDEAYGADLTFTRGPWLLRGEWLRGRQDALRAEGWYGLLLYRLGDRMEFLARHEDYDEDGGPASARRTTVGANYYFGPNTRLMLNYEFVSGTPPVDQKSGLRIRLQQIF